MTQAMYALLSQMDSIVKDPRVLGFEPTLQRIQKTVKEPLDNSFPPHNIIEKDDDNLVIELAIAGYTEEDVSVKVDDNQLIIEGGKESEDKYLHQGIANRKFRKAFTLGEFLVVQSAKLSDGILSVHIEKVIPEDKKPKVIEINGKKSKKSSLLKG